MRGLFADDAFVALDVCGTLDNDGTLRQAPLFSSVPNALACHLLLVTAFDAPFSSGASAWPV